jgi:hypothetical protein
VNHYLILRLTNAAIDCDQRGQGNLAALLTEAIDEIAKSGNDEPTSDDYVRCDLFDES